MDSATGKEAIRMRKDVLWFAVPAVIAAIGVSLWFTLIPGRSGAG